MVTVEAINERSPHLDTVRLLWRAHSDTLGFLPAGAFADYARKRHILVALREGQCIGYLLYRIVRERVAIAHFCVTPHARKQGVSRAMLNHLIGATQQCRGILLTCRRDYEASDTWRRLGFHPIAELDGRAANGSELVRWAIDYSHSDLFSTIAEPEALRVVIDFNIFLDLIERANEETDGLKACWLQPQVSLCYTAELLNEIERMQDGNLRKRRKTEVRRFTMLSSSPAAFQNAEHLLKPLFPNLTTPQDEADFRHLVYAFAAEADAFVTRDAVLLDHAEEVYTACGLSVVRPGELIAGIDTILHERDYQRRFVAGTRQISQERMNRAGNELVALIQQGGERKKEVVARLNRYLADPQTYRCQKVADSDGTTLAMFVVEHEQYLDRVLLLRICSKRRAGTLARSILTGLVRQAAKAGKQAVLIAEPVLPQIVEAACSDLGFLPVVGGRLKLVLSGWLAIDSVRAQIALADATIDELKAALPKARIDAVAASQIEHLVWPAKLADAVLPCFIVPIRAQFAEHLFDERLAAGGLFGADVDLALNPESAYYRAARPGVVTCPARVLWYVSSSNTHAGAKSIRACSRLVEVVKDKPKALYARFRRLGVYEWRHVLDTAKGDPDKEIMAFRFDDSELLRPLPWTEFQQILKANGISNNLQSPIEIPATVFGQIYAAALDPPQIC